MTVHQQYRMLYRFFGNFLHEDWMFQYADPNAAFGAFLAVLDAPELEQLLSDFERLFALATAEQQTVLGGLNLHEDVRADYGWDEREWLQSLRDRAAAELASKSGGG
jgi:hypothetical protein